MLHGIVPAAFQNVIEADDVGFDIDIRVVDAVADAGLGGEIDDNCRTVLLEHFLQQGLIRKIAPDEDMPYRAFFGGFLDLGQTPFFQTDLIIVVHAVKTDDGSARELSQQAEHEIRSDKAGGAGDQDGFIVQLNVSFHVSSPL